METGAEQLTWPVASVALGAMLTFTAVIVALVLQVAATWRARMSVAREEAYRRLSEESVAAQRRVAEGMERAIAELTSLRARSEELERMLKEVA